MNAAWHEKHRMPARATFADRVKWHVAHAKACACREMPLQIRQHLAKGPATDSHTVDALFAKREPIVRDIYDKLLEAVRKFGDVTEDPKKTSIHLNRVSAFAGVGTRSNALLVTIKSLEDIRSERIVKHERASSQRWYLDVRLEDPADVDRELIGWLRKSWTISA